MLLLLIYLDFFSFKLIKILSLKNKMKNQLLCVKTICVYFILSSFLQLIIFYFYLLDNLFNKRLIITV